MSIKNRLAAASKRAHRKAKYIRMNLISKECAGIPNTPGLAGALDVPIVENKERPESLEFLVLLFQDKSTDGKKSTYRIAKQHQETLAPPFKTHVFPKVVISSINKTSRLLPFTAKIPPNQFGKCLLDGG